MVRIKSQRRRRQAAQRALGNRSSSGFKHNAMFHPGCFCALSRSVAEFITGVRYLYYAAISASRSHIRISLSRVSPEPRAFALLRLHLKDGPPKNSGCNHIPRDLPSNLQVTRLPGCSAPRSIQRPTQLRSPSSSSPPHSRGLGYVSASPRQLPLFTPRFFHLRYSSVWAS